MLSKASGADSEPHPANIEGLVIDDEGRHLVDALDHFLLRSRVVVINDDIDMWVAGKLTRLFEVLAAEPKSITLLISSNGGDLAAGSIILRAMQHAQAAGCEIVGEVRGHAMSMAAVILQQCTLRLASPEDIVMIHGATGQTVGDIRNTEEDAKLMKRFMQSWAKFIAERNTSAEKQYTDPEFWGRWLVDNFPHYFFGSDALEAGLIDEVL